MFSDDFSEDWDSTKVQDDFIKKYFRHNKVHSKASLNILEPVDKSKNDNCVKISKSNPLKQNSECNGDEISNACLIKNKRSLNYQTESNKKIKSMKDLSQNSLQNIWTEIDSQSKNVQMIRSSSKLEPVKNKKKRKKLANRNKVILNDSYMKKDDTEEDSIAESKIVIDNISSDVEKSIDFNDNETNCLKVKKKRKKLRNKANNISEGKSVPRNLSVETEIINAEVSDSISTQKNELSENISDSSSVKKKKKKKKSKNIPTEKSPEPDKSFSEVMSSSIDNYNDSAKSNLSQNKAYQKLQAAKFRYLNEMLYTNSGKDALSYFQQNADEFMDYHAGYQSQVSKWPINPVDIIIQEISQMNKRAIIADLGCGEAKIAKVFSNRTVHSFDLIPLTDGVVACDMANVPLQNSSVDVVVFCLSLMGTNWKDYLKEGYRILKHDGIMKIAEIESRIEDLHQFVRNIENIGFSLINKNLSHKMFVFLNFKKTNRNKKSSKIPEATLKPCLYKRR